LAAVKWFVIGYFIGKRKAENEFIEVFEDFDMMDDEDEMEESEGL